MTESKMEQSNSWPTSPDAIDEKMECLGNRLAIVKTEMDLTEGSTGHSEQRGKTSDYQNTCDIPVKKENKQDAGRSMVYKENCENADDSGANQTADTKTPNLPRSKLIYSCHRCKLIFNSRISFENHYK